MFQETISNEELYELPLKHFEQEIVVVDHIDKVDEAVEYLQCQEILGFDTETRPSFKKGRINKVALLQLGTAEKVFLFRLNKIGLPKPLCYLLEAPSIKKVGVAIRDDIKVLQKLHNYNPEGFVELQDLVQDYGIQNFSLKKLSGIVLGFRISKSQRLSNWEALSLSQGQQVYAATDAWVAFQIYKELLSA
ncbi:3'-5' exonuclease domain-containing protein 2 [Prolixibacteraceae bacterium JC049]|jgi:ribonuclease D|nr:3'-5' exonuclease domain-containing protein 2 [Prolixibacteraceae bacterium JC049]